MAGARKANIAICYDFDGTLIRGNMQENSFLPDVGIPSDEFWGQVKQRLDLESKMVFILPTLRRSQRLCLKLTKTL